MRSYRRLYSVAILLLAVEFVVGLGGLLTPRGEVFPFASWFLFVLVPNHTVEYDLEFRSVDDHPLDPPVRFSQSARSINRVNQPHSIASFQTIQALGKALERGDQPTARALRTQIENFLGPGRLQYDVVRVMYDPVARYDTGAALNRRVLGTFVARE